MLNFTHAKLFLPFRLPAMGAIPPGFAGTIPTATQIDPKFQALPAYSQAFQGNYLHAPPLGHYPPTHFPYQHYSN